MKRLIAFLSFLLILTSCSNCKLTKDPVPAPVPTPVVDVDGGPPADDCAASCQTQRRLQCPSASGKSTPSGKTCETVCREDTAYNLHPACVAKAVSCDDVVVCFKR